MRVATAIAATTSAVALLVFTAAGTAVSRGVPATARPISRPPAPSAHAAAHAARAASSHDAGPVIPISTLNDVVKNYCALCHNDVDRTGNQSFDHFDIDSATNTRAMSEKMIRKLRAQMMPPPGEARPGGDTLRILVETMERVIDKNTRTNPGGRTFQRLNRPEYSAAIHDLLGLDVDAANYLPLDTKSANFDNIADVQMLSPTLLDAYLTAAGAVSRMAVGDAKAAATFATYGSSPFASQYPWNHMEGAPYGTRGGIVADHIFPADGMYSFRLNVFAGVGTSREDLDISIDGERIALLHYEKGIERSVNSADIPLGGDFIRSEPIFIHAGQQRVSAAFIRQGEGPYEDLIKPHDWSRASNGTASAGTTSPPFLVEMGIAGPQKVTGISETPTRKLIFSCRPAAGADGRACADQIVTRLGTKAYRRPLTAHDREGLMAFYDAGAKAGGFEEGVRTALQAILSSPYFVFRIENVPATVKPGQDYKISDYDLASRLSFFLWGSLPDETLMKLAGQGKLSDKKVLEQQVTRMLADKRSEALSVRFASQWLRLQDVDKVHPDAFFFPDFDQQLADDMVHETQLFFNDIVRRDGSVLDLYSANYTFVNERLAHQYGIPNVSGDEFQRVNYPDSSRRGILGQGSFLVLTSQSNRTSPVLRGKWVMEVLIGMPPPPPPPNVPDLEQTKETNNGKTLTTRDRMEIHRKNPVCAACHQYMDPIGLSLDNFDVTGRWRYRENGTLLDTRGKMYDGTPVASLPDLTNALLKRPIPLIRTFTENLMAYALGRRVEDFDQPTVRAIAAQAEMKGYRLSSFVLGVVNSPAFQTKRADGVTQAQDRP